MKEMILGNWNFMRLIRFGLGIAIMVHAAATGDWGLGMVGLVFTAMPLFNLGCCGSAGCAAPSRKSPATKTEIEYEEVV